MMAEDGKTMATLSLIPCQLLGVGRDVLGQYYVDAAVPLNLVDICSCNSPKIQKE
jgi:hypothetical protein